MYNMAVHFKDRLSQIFNDKGLASESSQLESLKMVAMESFIDSSTQPHLSSEFLYVFRLIADIVCSIIISKVKTQTAAVSDRCTQTDLNAPTTTTSSTIKLEKGYMDTSNDDDDDEHTTISLPSAGSTSLKALRRSSRSSVLNRKPKPSVKVKRASLPIGNVQAAECKSTVALNVKAARLVAKESAWHAVSDENGYVDEEEVEEERGEVNEKRRGSVCVSLVIDRSLYQRTSKGAFRCVQCGKETKKEIAMCRHLFKAHSGKDQKTYPCSQCLQSFKKPLALKRHQKTHNKKNIKETSHQAFPNDANVRTTGGKTIVSEQCLEFGTTGDVVMWEKKEIENCDGNVEVVEVDELGKGRGLQAGAVKKECTDWREQRDKGVMLPSLSSSSSSVMTGKASMGSMFQLTADGMFRCRICGQETKDRSNMRKHVLKWHAGEALYRCSKCPKAFTYPESLKFHQKVHVDPSSRAFERTAQGLYRCKQCGKECRNRSNVVKHVNRKHLKAGEKPFKCSLCPAVFGYSRSLKRHLLVHDGVRPFQCLQCDKSFFDDTSLRTHSRVHTNDRPYSCDICGNRFRQKEGLKGHMRSHTGDRPYVCERCGMAFAAKRSLTRHIRVHTGERPYSCDQCVAAFADWTTLHNHKLVHRQPDADDPYGTEAKDAGGQDADSESRPYQCQFCGIRYQQPLSLKRHLRIHSNASASKSGASKKPRKRRCQEGEVEESKALHLQYRPYRCEICSVTFKHLRGYKTHKNKHEKGTVGDKGSQRKLPARINKNHPSRQQGRRVIPDLIHQDIEQAATMLASVAVSSPNPQPCDSINNNNAINISLLQAPPPPQPCNSINNNNDNDAINISLLQPPQPVPVPTSHGTLTMLDPAAMLGDLHIANPAMTQPLTVAGPTTSCGGALGRHSADLIQYGSENIAEVIQYQDGSVGQVTTLVPPHSSSAMMPQVDILDSMVTVVFEPSDSGVNGV